MTGSLRTLRSVDLRKRDELMMTHNGGDANPSMRVAPALFPCSPGEMRAGFYSLPFQQYVQIFSGSIPMASSMPSSDW